MKTIAEPINIGDLQLVISSSIGIAAYPSNGTTGEQLIRNADTAMYRAKKNQEWLDIFQSARNGKDFRLRIRLRYPSDAHMEATVPWAFQSSN